MIRTLFFDFGNVIALFDHGRTVARLAHHTPLAPTELALTLFGGTYGHDFECGRISVAQYIDAVRVNGRLTCSPEEYHDAFVDIFEPNPPVMSLIPRLKNRYRLVLASNTNEAHFGHLSGVYRETLAHFDHLVLSHEVNARKPRAEFYTAAQRSAEAAPGECVFIDDLPTNIAAAEAHGWHGIVYTNPADLVSRLRALGVEAAPDA